MNNEKNGIKYEITPNEPMFWNFLGIDTGEKVKEGDASMYSDYDANDYAGWSTYMLTDADFGCTKFIEKQ